MKKPKDIKAKTTRSYAVPPVSLDPKTLRPKRIAGLPEGVESLRITTWRTFKPLP